MDKEGTREVVNLSVCRERTRLAAEFVMESASLREEEANVRHAAKAVQAYLRLREQEHSVGEPWRRAREAADAIALMAQCHMIVEKHCDGIEPSLPAVLAWIQGKFPNIPTELIDLVRERPVEDVWRTARKLRDLQ